MNAKQGVHFIKAHAGAAPLGLLLIGFMAVPLAWIAWGSVFGTAFDFSEYRRVFESGSNSAILARTLKIGLYVSLATLAVSYPVAYMLTRVKANALGLLSVLILVPLFTAFLIRTYAWMVILGREGIVNNFLLWAGFIDEPVKLLNTTLAVVIGMTHAFAPMAVFTLYSSLCQIDRRLVPAAAILGAEPVKAFTRIYFPLSAPALLSAGVLIFILSIGFYITPALLGGPNDMMMSQLIVAQMTTLLNFELAYATAMVLLAATLVTLVIAGFFIPLEQIWSSAAIARERGAGRFFARRDLIAPISRAIGAIIEGAILFLMRPVALRPGPFLWTYLIAFLVFLLAPLLVVLILSFSASPFVVFPPPRFSMQWWEKLADAKDWHDAFFFSVRLGLVSAIGATIIGAFGAFWLVRTDMRFKRFVFLACLSPMIAPVIVLAVALYIYEARLGILGTFPGLVIGHILLATPYAVVVMSSAIRGLDRSLEDAAAIHGATPPVTTWRITMPLLKPALVTSGLLAFITSFDELLVGLFLLGRQTPTLPIKFWADIRFQIDPLLSAASTFIIVIIIVAVIAAQIANKSRAGKTGPARKEG